MSANSLQSAKASRCTQSSSYDVWHQLMACLLHTSNLKGGHYQGMPAVDRSETVFRNIYSIPHPCMQGCNAAAMDAKLPLELAQPLSRLIASCTRLVEPMTVLCCFACCSHTAAPLLSV